MIPVDAIYFAPNFNFPYPAHVVSLQFGPAVGADAGYKCFTLIVRCGRQRVLNTFTFVAPVFVTLALDDYILRTPADRALSLDNNLSFRHRADFYFMFKILH